jgi:hypothetical protein
MRGLALLVYVCAWCQPAFVSGRSARSWDSATAQAGCVFQHTCSAALLNAKEVRVTTVCAASIALRAFDTEALVWGAMVHSVNI